MKDIIIDFIKSLKIFHSEKLCQSGIEIAENTLLSFAFPVQDLNFGEIYKNVETISPSFIFEKPNSSFKVLGLYSIFSISEDFKNEFDSISKKLILLKENAIDNWDNNLRKNIPLFLGGMKFSNSNNSFLWKDFESSNWFIPKYTFLQLKNSNFIIFNILLNSKNNFALKLNTINKELNTFLSNKNRNSEYSNFQNKIINKNGKIEKEEWINKIDKIITLINNKEIDKVVLSRKVSFKLNNKPNWGFIREELTKKFPTCHFFNYHKNSSFFFGSTPERLVKFKNGNVEIDALAGSAPRGKDEKEDKLFEKKLLKSDKNINEHNFVIDHIIDSIKESAKNIEVKNKYSILKLKNIQHLYSKVTAEFKNGCSPFDLLSKLYPTPAICGVSKDKALSIINKYENYERGMYSGIIGWFNLSNEGEFTVALRSAVTDGKKLTAFAGSGIVASSDSNTEFEETEIKLKAILNLFNEKK